MIYTTLFLILRAAGWHGRRRVGWRAEAARWGRDARLAARARLRGRGAVPGTRASAPVTPRLLPAPGRAGNGKTSGGRPGVTPWGLPTKGGYKTRKPKKWSNCMIVRRRPPGKHMRPRR